MKIIHPRAEIIEQKELYPHIAYCAGICYNSLKERNLSESLDFVTKLWNKGHISIRRHGTRYFRCKKDLIPNEIKFSPYCECELGPDKYAYISINDQFYVEHNCFYNCEPIYEDEVKRIGTYNIIRRTILLETSIAISRELNRVSPNNILEQSTRYVFEDGTICQPYWFNVFDVDYEYTYEHPFHYFKIENDQWISAKGLDYHTIDGYIRPMVESYLLNTELQFNNYKQLIGYGMSKQDARGLLPLDTATKCIYTYTLKEWKNIIDKRVHGTTGKPHPNAAIIMGIVEDLLSEELNYVI